MSDLVLGRLLFILKAISDRCAAITPPDPACLDSGNIERWLDDWFRQSYITIFAEVEEAASILTDQGLDGAAKRLGQEAQEVRWRFVDVVLHDMAKTATPEEIEFYTHTLGPFPLPLDDASDDENMRHDRLLAMVGHIRAFGEYTRRLLESIQLRATEDMRAKLSSAMSRAEALLTPPQLAADVALDDATMASAEGMHAHLERLGAYNTVVQSWLAPQAASQRLANSADVTPEKSPDAAGRDTQKKSPVRLPDNPDVRDLCHLLGKNRDAIAAGKKSAISVARQFTKEQPGNDAKAQSLMRQARRFSHLWKP